MSILRITVLITLIEVSQDFFNFKERISLYFTLHKNDINKLSKKNRSKKKTRSHSDLFGRQDSTLKRFSFT